MPGQKLAPSLCHFPRLAAKSVRLFQEFLRIRSSGMKTRRKSAKVAVFEVPYGWEAAKLRYFAIKGTFKKAMLVSK